MSVGDDDFGAFLDLPDITPDLNRLDRPTESPTSLLTVLTNSPTGGAISTPAPSFAATTSTPTDQASTLSTTNEPSPSPTSANSEALVSTPLPTIEVLSPSNNDGGADLTSPPPTVPSSSQEELIQEKSYFSCPAPAPQTVTSRDDNGVPVDIVIDPPVASCHVSYDFELQVTNHSYTVTTASSSSSGSGMMMTNETNILAYIESLLPGIEDRLGDVVANYLMLHTEYSADMTTCGGYIVTEFQRERMLLQHHEQHQQQHPGRKRLRSEDTSSSSELTKIISLTGEEYQIDPVNECDPPDRTCYVVNGKMNATYVGYDEPGVKSSVSRLVKREMDKSQSNGPSLREYSYGMRYIGPSNNVGEDMPAQSSPVTPSAILSAEDIMNTIPDNVNFHPTPIGIGIIAALAAAFVMACYARFSKEDGELKEEVIEEIQVAKHKMRRRKNRKKHMGDDELLVEDNGNSEANSSLGYDLESVAIDVKSGGVDDEEAVEIQETYSFGHTAAVEHMTRSEKGGKSTYSLAEAVRTIPRPEPNGSGSRDIRKKNSPKKIAASRAAKLASEISADVRMISGCQDSQTSADANITAFELPNPQGRAGGACTAALLQVLYKGHKTSAKKSWAEVLREMRGNLASKGYDQIPQLTCSRIIDVNGPMDIVPKHSTGTKRAVLIGINYTGQSGALSGCHNDIKHIAQYLQKVHGFCKQNMTLLLDNGKDQEPNYSNIIMALERVARESRPGDTVWFHYSGHGGRLPDNSNEEQDGYDETIIPLDFKRRGQIRDDDLLKYFVKPMKRGVTVNCVMDCCHSGTVLDLPYQFLADGEHRNMEANNKFSRNTAKTTVRSPSGSAAILQDLEATSRTSPTSRGSPRRADSLAIPKLPSVPETDLPPPIHDTPSHRSKVSRLISPTSVNEINLFPKNHSVVMLRNSEGEEQWEV
ncbi:hypothetical protein HJC23_009686 [Cyclotella cryptica]|uniref:Peptidase C14 caspase domain-containing protein n=1 Tax=Cyclotella cryptica TaxID=29204 RepID=A0ABD3Q8P2_9STRA